MATQARQPPSPFAKPIFALKMKLATVKVFLGSATIWTGTIVGQKHQQTLILSVAHPMTNAANWMDKKQFESTLRVRFFGDTTMYPCRIEKVEVESDIMVLVVPKSTPENRIMKFAPEAKWDLVESQVLGARGHPGRQHEWVLAEGPVAAPMLLNEGLHNVMWNYCKDLRFFEHKLPMGNGYSGAALVDSDGNLVGMQSGALTHDYKVLGIEPMATAITKRKQVIRSKFYAQNSQIITQKLEAKLSNARVDMGGLGYGLMDVVNFSVTSPSCLSFAIHVGYLKHRLQGTSGRRLEDIFISNPSVAGSSSTAPSN